MAGEFFSGAVCQKENGENCSTEAAVDSRFTLVKKMYFVHRVVFVCDRGGRQDSRVLSTLNPHVCACMG